MKKTLILGLLFWGLLHHPLQANDKSKWLHDYAGIIVSAPVLFDGMNKELSWGFDVNLTILFGSFAVNYENFKNGIEKKGRDWTFYGGWGFGRFGQIQVGISTMGFWSVRGRVDLRMCKNLMITPFVKAVINSDQRRWHYGVGIGYDILPKFLCLL